MFFRDKFKHINDLKSKDVMNEAFLSLGGNLGDRLTIIRSAVTIIGEEWGQLLKSSSLYETDAWGSDSKKKFLNQVIKIKTKYSAEQLLKQIHRIEKMNGRKRTQLQYSDRTLDIDLLFFNNEIIERENLLVPHPMLHLRKFVLIPLNEIEPKLVHPVFKKSIKTLLKQCKDPLSVTPFVGNSLPLHICIEGNIGSGKTTLSQSLAKKWNAIYLPEIFEENSLLPLFYANPDPYAFSMEYSFLISRFEQITNLKGSSKKIIISDYSFYKSLWFAKVNLSKKEFAVFEKNFKTLVKLVPAPDLIVYLDTSIGNLKKNIKKRGRPYELNMKTAYLKLVAKSYREGMSELHGVEKLTISVKSYDRGLEAKSIKTLENYIKVNFGSRGKKTTFDLVK